MFNNPQYIGPVAEQGTPLPGLGGQVQGMISAPTGPVAYLPVQQPTYSPQQLQDMRQKYVLPPTLDLRRARQTVQDLSNRPEELRPMFSKLQALSMQQQMLSKAMRDRAMPPRSTPAGYGFYQRMMGHPTVAGSNAGGVNPPQYPRSMWDNLYAGGSAQLIPSVGATKLATPLQPGVR